MIYLVTMHTRAYPGNLDVSYSESSFVLQPSRVTLEQCFVHIPGRDFGLDEFRANLDQFFFQCDLIAYDALLVKHA